MARNYSNVAEQTSLTTGINSSAVSITVDSNTGYPSVPYTILIDPGLATEEVCEVTAVAGTTWTVTRGVDGTPATSHDTGAAVVHGWSARDFRDSQDHIAATSGVHGVSGALVGTSSTQTLSNKTLTAPTINGGTLNSVTLGAGLTLQSPTLVTPTIASFVNAQHDHSSAASGGVIEGSGGGGDGGGTAGIAYKRSGSTQEVFIDGDGESLAVPIAFSSQVYNVGGKTFTSGGGNTRITLPSDVDDAVWNVSANVSLAVLSDTDMPLMTIVHQDEGTIATQTAGDGFGGIDSSRWLSASTDFQANSGRWIEVRIGSLGEGPVDYFVNRCSVAIHRVA